MRRRSLHLVALVLAAATALWAVPALAENYALLLAISSYPRQPLPGVVKDMDNGQAIAKLLGVPEQNITLKTDTDLAGQGLGKALDEFAARIKPGDRAFVYYSGHGTSYTKPGKPGTCEQALVAQDINTLMPKEEFHRRISAIAAKADKTFVFLDSCFSGGLVQATHSKSMPILGKEVARSKFTSVTEADPCSKSTNERSKSGRDFGVAEAAKQPNYYLLAAAAENEVAIDGSSATGGFASSSLLNCLQEPAKSDKNNDGVVTLEEAKACAQGLVDERIRQGQASPSFQFSHMTLTAGYGQGGNPPIAFTSTSAPVNTTSFAQTLYEGRDATRQVNLRSDKNPVRIGDDLNLELTSDRPGYLTLMVVGSSGKIYQIFPNQMDSDARVEAGRPMPIPRPEKWRMPASPPAGDNWFLALISDTPDRFQGLGEQAGIFKGMGNTGTSTKGIIERIVQPANGCAQGYGGRDFEMRGVNPCSTGYGAALIKVTEIQ